MIAHLFKLIWNRKRANALILTELCAAFLVLAALATAGAYFLHNARLPLGYSIDDVWLVGVGHGITRRAGVPPEAMAEAMATTKQLLATVGDLPDVVGVTAAVTGPGAGAGGIRNTKTSDGTDIPVLGRGLLFEIDNVSDTFAQVFEMKLLRGRWFGREDDGGQYHPAVINERMAADFFWERRSDRADGGAGRPQPAHPRGRGRRRLSTER
jgi:putative ABC transport system permease protein